MPKDICATSPTTWEEEQKSFKSQLAQMIRECKTEDDIKAIKEFTASFRKHNSSFLHHGFNCELLKEDEDILDKLF